MSHCFIFETFEHVTTIGYKLEKCRVYFRTKLTTKKSMKGRIWKNKWRVVKESERGELGKYWARDASWFPIQRILIKYIKDKEKIRILHIPPFQFVTGLSVFDRHASRARATESSRLESESMWVYEARCVRTILFQ